MENLDFLAYFQEKMTHLKDWKVGTLKTFCNQTFWCFSVLLYLYTTFWEVPNIPTPISCFNVPPYLPNGTPKMAPPMAPPRREASGVPAMLARSASIAILISIF